MRFGFFFHEAVRALTRNAVPSFAAMATVLVTVLVLGVFIPVVQATTGAANEVRSRVMADVYLVSNVKPADVARVRGIIENETPHVKRVQYVPKEKAIAAERKAGRGAYYDLLGANPLPDTFRIYPDKPDNISKVRNALAPLSPSGGRTVVGCGGGGGGGAGSAIGAGGAMPGVPPEPKDQPSTVPGSGW